ncbi:DMT family transporter [Nitratidesulfovibrio sp. SRB-5]|uniref:DMT family transporter n=1 Tax=Nitratidesulfovibrio sp. SRB-5 TaxID=2872636 RepID=UPI0010268656|nr:DMT family transporter [Nitratidesulfovibrio sp. SRB-5]MBZ2171147.1 DMT family transporter [Nitratidesulfovibrio sp. SRB-5]RXF77929.1 EamA family transporter [Desulfovibrio sp. DS-1]
MPAIGTGELAALSTAALWAVSCQIHAILSRRLGAHTLILLRLPICIVMFGAWWGASVLFFGGGVMVPGSFGSPSPLALAALALSGVFGVALCDLLFYSGVVLVGARVALLVQSLSTVITAVLGYLFLGEAIGPLGIAGILIATGGVAWVVGDGGTVPEGAVPLSRTVRLRGVGLAFASALALSGGMVLSKQGLAEGVDPLFAALLRMVVAMGVFWPTAMLTGRLRPALAVVRGDSQDRRNFRWLLVASLIGPVVGVWLSLVAIGATQTGIAATLIGLEPIFIIPVAALVERRWPTPRAIAGAGIAFVGTALLCLRNVL